MGCDCGSCIAKTLLATLNGLFTFLGTILIILGLWLVADKTSLIAYLKIVEPNQLENFTQPAVFEPLGALLIIIGLVMCIISFFGYYGALWESQCMLMTYVLILVVIFIAQGSAIALTLANKDRVQTQTKTYLQSTISNYYTSSEHNQTDAVTLTWNYVMFELHCCGVDDYRDFALSEKWNESKRDKIIPTACCVQTALLQPQDKNCPISPTESNSYFKKGCYNALIDWMYNLDLILIVGIAVFSMQLLATFVAIWLSKSIAKYRGMRL